MGRGRNMAHRTSPWTLVRRVNRGIAPVSVFGRSGRRRWARRQTGMVAVWSRPLGNLDGLERKVRRRPLEMMRVVGLGRVQRPWSIVGQVVWLWRRRLDRFGRGSGRGSGRWVWRSRLLLLLLGGIFASGGLGLLSGCLIQNVFQLHVCGVAVSCRSPGSRINFRSLLWLV